MQVKKKLNKLISLYIIFFSTLLFINIILTSPIKANSFKINELGISEPFELNFNKEKIIEKAFIEAFNELISMITTSGDKKIIENTSIETIKTLIDSFTISNEKFVNNEYKAKFDVNFNKKNTLDFFEKKNIFPSIPKKKKILLIPILIDLEKDQILLFTNNIFYKQWNKENKRYYLLNYLLPEEDIEDVNFIVQNNKSIEDYDFKNIINKYDISDYIIVIIYKDKNNLKILSKIQLNNLLKIDNQTFMDIDLLKPKDFELILNQLKKTYENQWKNINQINTSIKLPMTIIIDARDHEKIKVLENTLLKLDFVSSFEISSFNSQNIFFRIVYNGSPKKFIEDIKDNGFDISLENQIWKIK